MKSFKHICVGFGSVLVLATFFATVSIYDGNIWDSGFRDILENSRILPNNNQRGSANLTWVEIQTNRARNLKEQCQRLKEPSIPLRNVNRSRLAKILVNDEHKLIYCFVPKVASTNLRRIFIALTGKFDPKIAMTMADVYGPFYRDCKFLNSYSPEEADQRVKDYKKIIFVRDPMERVLSTFRHQMSTILTRAPNSDHAMLARSIIKQFRNATTTKIKTKELVFSEFADYLADIHKKGKKFDQHWSTYYDLCLPCHINYDFIGKFENLDDDVNHLLKHLSVDHLMQLPGREVHYDKSKTLDVLHTFYKDLTPAQIQGLENVYARDQQLFLYDTPEQLQRLSKA